MSEWQPIEKAPRDGTRILCWDGRSVEMTWWSRASHIRFYGWVDLEISSLDEVEIGARPTHWMPLPEPPKGEQE